MRNFSSEKRLLVVALDHIPLGIMPGWEHAEKTLKAVIAGQPDYIVVNFGILKRFSALFQGGPRTVLRLDGSPSYLVDNWLDAAEWHLLYSIEDALRLGASAAIVNLVVGGPAEMQSVRAVARAASACLERQFSLFVSAVPSAKALERDHTEVTAFAARLASELGADIVNLYYDGDAKGLEYIVPTCPAPIVLAGGALKSDVDTLRRVRFAVDAGCLGVCYGRSIWQSRHPTLVMKAVRSLLLGSQSLDAAIQSLSEDGARLA